MRRPLVYALIAAITGSALGLAAYSYRASRELSESERTIIVGTMRELAREKVLGIEAQMDKASTDVFEKLNIQNLKMLKDMVDNSALRSALVLDKDAHFVPDGIYSKRQDDAESAAFRRLFTERVLPDLDLKNIFVSQVRHLHKEYDDLPYQFSATKRYFEEKSYYIVVEFDLSYLLTGIFPQFFDVQSPHLYQVVDQNNELIYGHPFRGISDRDVVETGFGDSLRQWRLRVTQRDSKTLSAKQTQQRVLDFAFIISALFVIVAGVIAMVVTVRREQRVSRLKSDFISNVSHELKTPLSIISMFGELLSLGRAKSPEQAREYAELIHRESVRLSRLIDSVLDFAKIERGVDVYEFLPDQDMKDVIERALEISRHRLTRAEMEASFSCDDDLPLATLDPNAITLTVLNFIDNAIKYAPAGKKLDIHLGKTAHGLELSVRDWGPGIPTDEYEAVFDRFYRSREVRLKPIRGSGIGLALVKHIAEAHHGGVSVESPTDGQGARFRLWVPAQPDRDS